MTANMRAAAVAILALALGACTDTNVAGPASTPAPPGLLVFASDRGGRDFELWSVRGDGSALTRLTSDTLHNDLAPVLSRSGRRIAWEREITRPGEGVVAVELWVMNLDGSDAHAVVANGSENRAPSWGAGDSSLVYASYVGGDFDIWRVPLDPSARAAGAAANLTHEPYADQWPRVAPDGRSIVFQTNRDLDFEIYVMDADGGNARNLTNRAGDDRFPAWSPDGRTIAWSRYAGGFDIWAMAADGSSPRALVATPFDEVAPTISPDGATVAFESDEGGRTALFAAPMAGGAPHALLPPPASGADRAPAWGVLAGAGSSR